MFKWFLSKNIYIYFWKIIYIITSNTQCLASGLYQAISGGAQVGEQQTFVVQAGTSQDSQIGDNADGQPQVSTTNIFV